jgi:mono/diheme cytochrome c family protein
MMRNSILVLLVLIVLSSCKSEEKWVNKQISYWLPEIPAHYSQADSVKTIEAWKLGIRSFERNCSSCHGIFTKGKPNVPNWGKESFDDYNNAFLAGDTANHAVLAKMTPKEMDAVFLFLMDLQSYNK